ncbi:hypothetical protein [Nocardia nova]|uniref:hypothetical protein n=1 Tax=Nocardia nova TaxID=37330 RepID=UPI002739E9B5|nr:hypothetical protein [Nocardia nova]
MKNDATGRQRPKSLRIVTAGPARNSNAFKDLQYVSFRIFDEGDLDPIFVISRGGSVTVPPAAATRCTTASIPLTSKPMIAEPGAGAGRFL